MDLLVVPGVVVILGEISRDPRLNGLQFDNLFAATRVIALDPEGERIARLLIIRGNAEGQVQGLPISLKDDGGLILPREEQVSLWICASGFRPRSTVSNGEEECRVSLERSIRVMLRCAPGREWDMTSTSASPAWIGGGSILPGAPTPLGDVLFDRWFFQGGEHLMFFPGPGRYELGLLEMQSIRKTLMPVDRSSQPRSRGWVFRC